MKVLRQIKTVKVYECGDNEETSLSLTEFDSKPPYYKSVIRPMLMVGHEGELINWMKNMGLLRSSQSCNNVIEGTSCQGIMIWTPAKIVDHYQWRCKICLKKRTIREDSIFQDIKCHLKDSLRILAGWCKGTDVDTMAKLLCIKKQAVNAIYNVAATVALGYIKTNPSLWKIGGPNVVVLIDTYPDNLSTLQYEVSVNNNSHILCMAEAKEIPTRYWLQVLDRFNSDNQEQLQNANMQALQIIQETVKPGSILVANLDAKLCSYATLQSLKHIYPVIVTTEGLKRHGTMGELFGHLETIWRPALEICKESQYYPFNQMQNFIVRELWTRRFANEAFEILINHMCYM